MLFRSSSGPRLFPTKAELEARRDLGWERASKILPDPRDYRLPSIHAAHPSGVKKKTAIKHKKKIKEDFESDKEAAKQKLIGSPGYLATQERQRPAPGAFGTKPKPVSPAVKHYDPEAEKARQDKLTDIAGKGVKDLKAPSAGQDTVSRYQQALDRAKSLQARGRSGAVSKLKWSKGGMKARAAREVGGFKSFMKGFGSNVISGIGE